MLCVGVVCLVGCGLLWLFVVVCCCLLLFGVVCGCLFYLPLVVVVGVVCCGCFDLFVVSFGFVSGRT